MKSFLKNYKNTDNVDTQKSCEQRKLSGKKKYFCMDEIFVTVKIVWWKLCSIFMYCEKEFIKCQNSFNILYIYISTIFAM